LAWNPQQQQYQRPRMSGFSMFPTGIKFLLGSNVAIFLIELLFGDLHFAGGLPLRDAIVEYFALWPLTSGHFLPWQLFTYMFLHEGFTHILFNMLMLWWVGVQVEQALGTRRFLIYYFVCGLGGATAHLLLSGFFGMGGGPMLGASGAIFGVLVAFGVMFPEMRLIFFPIFIPIRAKFVVPILIAIEIYSTYNSSDNVAHLAHLGGAVTGMIYMLIMSGGKILASRRNSVQSQWGNGSANVPKNGGFFGKRPGGVVDADYRDIDNYGGGIADTKIQDVKQARVITQEEIDRILDKIAATGYQNLTNDERDILFEASRRMEEKR
jgi:membrane associated rhomboid family serine protease